MIKMRLHILLAEKRITQSELAKITKIRQPTISNYCSDKAISIKLEHINKICNALDCQPCDLFEFTKD